MALLLAALIGATVLTGAIAGVPINEPASLFIAVVLVAGGFCPIPAYAHETGRIPLRESSLALMWAFAFAVTLPLSVLALARLAMPLQDRTFASIDRTVGVSASAIAAWAHHHLFGQIINFAYGLLVPWLGISTLVIGLSGQWLRARTFVVANVIAFAIGLPLYATFPAVGPWYGSGVTPTPFQLECQNSLLAVRSGATPAIVGIVCFPSFHVIWAVLCIYAFWGFRWFRVPAVLLGAAIVVSTVTTGWHYFVDVVAGLLVAWISLRFGQRFAGAGTNPRKEVPEAVRADSAVVSSSW